MKGIQISVFVMAFLFLVVLPLNVQSVDVFDTITDIDITATSFLTVSDVQRTSNLIQYDDKIEFIYATTSDIRNGVLTYSGGSFSESTYTMKNTPLSIYQIISLTDNSTDLRAFICDEDKIQEYGASKSDHSWSFISNVTDCTIATYHIDYKFEFDKNGVDMIGSHGRDNYLYNCIKISGTWNCTDDYVHSCCRFPVDVHESNVTENFFTVFTIGSASDDYYGLMERFPAGGNKYGSLQTLSGGFVSPQEYRGVTSIIGKDSMFAVSANQISNDFYAMYVYDTNNSLGMGCTINYNDGSTWYACKEQLSSNYNKPSNDPESYVTKTTTQKDINGNIHFTYLEGTSSGNITFIMQDNSYTEWVRYVPLTYSSTNLWHDFVLWGSGKVITELSSSELHFYSENESLEYIGSGTCVDGTPYNTCSATQPLYCTGAGSLINNCNICGCLGGEICQLNETCVPSTGEVVEDTSLGLICGAGSFLTGTTYEGGCLVVALFVLAISLTILGTIFHYYEKELEKEIASKYLITGGFAIAMIVFTMLGGLTDLFTGISAIFLIFALILAYEERSTMKK